MGRAAGDGSHYTWVLRDLSSGKYDQSSTISLPSVTTIIGRVLAKPALIPWTYRETRDAISGLVHLLMIDANNGEYTEHDVLELLADADELEAYLKENKLRPEDQKTAAQNRGKAAHSMLEELGLLALENDDAAADALAQRILEKTTYTQFDKATASWWVDREPRVVASEHRLLSLTHRYAGSTDLIWRDRDDALVLTDLKSRRAGQPAWESDHIQVGGYSIAWEEMGNPPIDRETVLVVREDGTWDEYESTVDNRGVFLSLLDVYAKLTRR